MSISRKLKFKLGLSLIVILLCLVYIHIHFTVQQTDTLPIVIEPLILCKDITEEFEAIEPTETFYIDSTEIHGLVKFKNLPQNSIIMTKWNYIGDKNMELNATSVTVSGKDTAHFFIKSPENGWYIGDYLIEIYLNDTLIESKGFRITYK